jgi:hypothetical protein
MTIDFLLGLWSSTPSPIGLHFMQPGALEKRNGRPRSSFNLAASLKNVTIVSDAQLSEPRMRELPEFHPPERQS